MYAREYIVGRGTNISPVMNARFTLKKKFYYRLKWISKGCRLLAIQKYVNAMGIKGNINIGSCAANVGKIVVCR